jgi:hypothetical protein
MESVPSRRTNRHAERRLPAVLTKQAAIPSTTTPRLATAHLRNGPLPPCLLDGLGWLRDTVPSGLREFLTPAHTFWTGALLETDFFSRLYDLDELPSNDPRYTTALQDIVQHRVMNEDWDDDWIFHDWRFGLAGSDKALLQFLAEMLHPAMRTDPVEVERLRNSSTACWPTTATSWSRSTTSAAPPLFAPRRIGAGVRGTMKNLILAAIGPKPEIVLVDAVNNDLRITDNV